MPMTNLLRRENVANRVLLALPQASLERIAPYLEPVDLIPGQPLYYPEKPIKHLYFLNRGLVALVATMRDGRSVATGAIGIEGVTGPDPLFGITNALLECTVQIPGYALRITPDVLRREWLKARRSGNCCNGSSKRSSPSSQTAACNRCTSLLSAAAAGF